MNRQSINYTFTYLSHYGLHKRYFSLLKICMISHMCRINKKFELLAQKPYFITVHLTPLVRIFIISLVILIEFTVVWKTLTIRMYCTHYAIRLRVYCLYYYNPNWKKNCAGREILFTLRNFISWHVYSNIRAINQSFQLF